MRIVIFDIAAGREQKIQGKEQNSKSNYGSDVCNPKEYLWCDRIILAIEAQHTDFTIFQISISTPSKGFVP